MFNIINFFLRLKKFQFNISNVLFVLFVILFIFGTIFWYFPIGGSHPASFFSGDIPLTITPIAQTNHLIGEHQLRGDPDGKFLIFGASDHQIFMSSDSGYSWEKKDELRQTWNQNFLVSPDGNFITTYATMQPPGSIIFSSSKYPEKKKIYQGGFNKYDVPEGILSLDMAEASDGIWILFLKAAQYFDITLKLLHSEDGKQWYDEGEIKLKCPHWFNLPSILADSEGNKFITVIDGDFWIDKKAGEIYKMPKNYKLTVLKRGKDDYDWQRIIETLAPRLGRGFKCRLIFSKEDCIDEKGNLYIFWTRGFSRWIISPLLPEMRDEIYFAILPKNSHRFSTIRRINDTILSYKENVTRFEFMTGKEFVDDTQKSPYFVRVKASVSKNGKYLATAWTDYRQEGKSLIYFSYSNDFGKHWSKNQPVYPDLTDMTSSFDIFVSNEGSLHIIFTSKKNNMIYYVSGKIE